MHSTPIVLTATDVEPVLTQIDVRAALTRAFHSLANGQVTQPPPTLSLFPYGDGDFIIYLGILADEGVFGAKLSPYIPTGGAPIITAWTLLLSTTSGEPLLLCDAKQLTVERTAGTTALAVDLLAPAEARTPSIVGTGPVGLAHLRHVAILRALDEIRVCSPNAHQERAQVEQAASARPVVLFNDIPAAVDGADVIMLCTSSGTPVLNAADIAQAALVTSISTNAANAHEIDPSALSQLDEYSDYRATTPQAAGEMRLATAAGQWSPNQLLGDLPELLSGRATAPSHQRPAFFRSVGLSLEDNALGAAAFAAVRP